MLLYPKFMPLVKKEPCIYNPCFRWKMYHSLWLLHLHVGCDIVSHYNPISWWNLRILGGFGWTILIGFPWGKARDPKGELSGTSFPECEAWRVPRDSIIVTRVLRSTFLRLPSWLVLDSFLEGKWDSLRDCSVEKGVQFLGLYRLRGNDKL